MVVAVGRVCVAAGPSSIMGWFGVAIRREHSCGPAPEGAGGLRAEANQDAELLLYRVGAF